MSYAVMYPETEKRGPKTENSLYIECTNSKVSKQYTSNARHVLRNAPQFVTEIMAGTMPLSEAYQQSKYLAEMRELKAKEKQEKEKQEAKEQRKCFAMLW